MKKIPTLFVRQYADHKVVGISPTITAGLEGVLENGKPTIKIDGSCCAIINGQFYKRYDAKNGKMPPEGAIPCCDPDPITGHWPHWLKVTEQQPDSKWHIEALKHATRQYYAGALPDGTYEAIGLHFQGNPYGMNCDTLVKHGETEVINLVRTFDGIKEWLSQNAVEGIVFWVEGCPVCKIKRSDFGFDWPVKDTK